MKTYHNFPGFPVDTAVSNNDILMKEGVWKSRHAGFLMKGVWNQLLRNPKDFESLILMTCGSPYAIRYKNESASSFKIVRG